ncbi:Zn(II)2Cys6 transcription factor [Aspergillus clavatus NRRL 1]|uniref:C6 transcription factor, putative n=1 Tax=Aspergillus clavatus (strain ATCC 1007 / CBS 513.65 / DSM 816 / NCTC 3887 / NRRL 1 / QM 1276 / 107) TaxID=344612 RepID=A1CN77_ASPCL|nr:C6 transcription factor, putative [Aspergillus clavatus NRRL 1]EAW07098.1 C6 transcription factor, putative [Aspergillus clavatus NRRL 1]
MPGARSSQSKAQKKLRCHTCRRQRIVCDAGKPACSRCISRGVECLGYAEYPIRWVEPSSNISSSATRLYVKGNSPESRGSQKRKRGRPKLSLMHTPSSGGRDQSTDTAVSDHSPGQSNRDSTAVTARSRSSSTIPLTLLPTDYERNRLILEFSSYYNDYICPDLVIVDSSRNPHRINFDFLPHVPDFLVNLIVSASAIHQVIRAQPQWALIVPDSSQPLGDAVHQGDLEHFHSFHHPLKALIYRHKSQSLQGLNRYLSEVDGQGTDLIIGAVAVMVLCEIQQSAFRNWKIHHEALRSILTYRGGFAKLASSRYADLGSALRIFMLVDIMSSITIPSQSLPPSTSSQLAYIEHLPTLYCDGLEQGFPCPSEMLAAIVHTNNLRWIIHHHSVEDSGPMDNAIQDLVTSIVTFAPITWAERAQGYYAKKLEARNNQPRPSSSLNLVSQSDEQTDWIILASAFKAATLLYCLRALIFDHGKEQVVGGLISELHDGLITDAGSLAQESLTSLLGILHSIMMQLHDHGDWLGRFMFWPLFMAGMESACSSDGIADREFIVRSLQELCHRLGDMSVLDAAVFLQSAWSLSHEDSINPTWDATLERLGVHGLFFF